MILLIQFQILLDILQKVKYILIEICIKEIYIHQLTFYHHFLVWWKELLEKVWPEGITLMFPIKCMHFMLKVKILKQWKQSLVRRLWRKKIDYSYNFMIDLKMNLLSKVIMKKEQFLNLLIKHGIYYHYSKKKNYQRLDKK